MIEAALALFNEGCRVKPAGKRYLVIALLGVQGIVVVQTPDAILVCDRAKGQEIKKIVAMLPKKLR